MKKRLAQYKYSRNDLKSQVKSQKDKILQLKEKVLTQKNEKNNKNQFIAAMIHELRNPLNSVLGSLDIISNRIKELPLDKIALIKNAQDSGEVLLGMISNILDASKIESGKFDLNIEPTEIRKFIFKIVQVNKANALRKGLKFSMKTDAPVPKRLNMDQQRMMQVLMNLIGNAIKFTDEGKISVETKWEPNKDSIAEEDRGKPPVIKYAKQTEEHLVRYSIEKSLTESKSSSIITSNPLCTSVSLLDLQKSQNLIRPMTTFDLMKEEEPSSSPNSKQNGNFITPSLLQLYVNQQEEESKNSIDLGSRRGSELSNFMVPSSPRPRSVTKDSNQDFQFAIDQGRNVSIISNQSFSDQLENRLRTQSQGSILNNSNYWHFRNDNIWGNTLSSDIIPFNQQQSVIQSNSEDVFTDILQQTPQFQARILLHAGSQRNTTEEFQKLASASPAQNTENKNFFLFTNQENDLLDQQLSKENFHSQTFINSSSPSISNLVIYEKGWEKQGTLKIIIKDTGCGISEESLQKLFKPFQQADKQISKRYGGTGLGLWISQIIIKEMKGQIEVKSQIGKGTIFTLQIPLEVSKPQKPDKNFVLIKQMKIIYVSKPGSKNRIKYLLRVMGIEVYEVNAQQEAIINFYLAHKNKQFDMIMIDNIMEHLEILLSINFIRDAERMQNQTPIPVYILSRNLIESERIKQTNRYINGVILKNMKQEQLVKFLNESVRVAQKQLKDVLLVDDEESNL